jgi:hypothetical protein
VRQLGAAVAASVAVGAFVGVGTPPAAAAAASAGNSFAVERFAQVGLGGAASVAVDQGGLGQEQPEADTQLEAQVKAEACTWCCIPAKKQTKSTLSTALCTFE